MYPACHIFPLHKHAYSVMGEHFRRSPLMILSQYELFGMQDVQLDGHSRLHRQSCERQIVGLWLNRAACCQGQCLALIALLSMSSTAKICWIMWFSSSGQGLGILLSSQCFRSFLKSCKTGWKTIYIFDYFVFLSNFYSRSKKWSMVLVILFMGLSRYIFKAIEGQ